MNKAKVAGDRTRRLVTVKGAKSIDHALRVANRHLFDEADNWLYLDYIIGETSDEVIIIYVPDPQEET